ncbi:ankyrin repeat domain-containing protein 50 isoform X2 [Calliphora vicina]|uniref:ankyrin repeat domain-containing protein 50 isoform X2 n=1 Tax=Calliphora vicina TaxID=7373 RepID=UPI00325A67E4
MVKGILVNRKTDESFKAQLKMEHSDLVAEMQTVENLPTHERLQLARLRRAQQLKVARQKEKEWLKLQRAKGVNLATLNGMNTTHHFRNGSNSSSSSKRHISFENSVVLLEAASRNDMHEVAELLEHGITPDAANEDGLTALHQCCIDNNVEMLKLLLEYGANVDAQDSDKWTPLHAAATCGHLELVRILIDHGANLLAVNTDGNMPYDLCDDENTLDYIEAEMSKRGVTQELIDETRSATERLMLRDLMELSKNTGDDLEQPDEHGATPLHIASANGYIKVVEFLLEQHVNVDALDRDMWSPVHAAACWGHLEVLEMLAQCGADLNIKNKDDETPSDICEDPEIRERIEQLKTEQESKRLAEAQRRRVRRSQSNNTRAQSVRRTSLRDKTLTTKKDAVEEARLRLQAQEVFVTAAPDSTTLDPNGVTDHHNHHPHHAQLEGSAADWLSKNSTAAAATQQQQQHHNNNNNNTLKTNNNHRNSYDPSLKDMVDSNSISSMSLLQQQQQQQQHSYQPRRPPEGGAGHINALNGVGGLGVGVGGSTSSSSTVGVDGTSSTATTAAAVIAATTTTTGHGTEAVQIQSSKEATNGKINVQVTVLVDTSNTHNLQQQQSQSQPTHLHHNQQQHQTQQQQQQHMHMHLHGGHGHYNNLTGSTTATFHNQLPHHNPPQQLQQLQQLQQHQHHPLLQLQHHPQLLDTSSQCLANATTLANLKKQRSMSRSNVLNGSSSSNCENGSVLGAANSTNLNHNHISHNNHTTSNNNNNNNTLEGQVNTQQPVLSNGLQHPALMDYNGLINDPSSQHNSAGVGGGGGGVGGAGGVAGSASAAGGMNKFSGVTGDVVSDSTSSKKCCIVM